MTTKAAQAAGPLKSVNFDMGFEAGMADKDYRPPCRGNQKAEDDYAVGYHAGETMRLMQTTAEARNV